MTLLHSTLASHGTHDLQMLQLSQFAADHAANGGRIFQQSKAFTAKFEHAVRRGGVHVDQFNSDY